MTDSDSTQPTTTPQAPTTTGLPDPLQAQSLNTIPTAPAGMPPHLPAITPMYASPTLSQAVVPLAAVPEIAVPQAAAPTVATAVVPDVVLENPPISPEETAVTPTIAIELPPDYVPLKNSPAGENSSQAAPQQASQSDARTPLQPPPPQGLQNQQSPLAPAAAQSDPSLQPQTTPPEATPLAGSQVQPILSSQPFGDSNHGEPYNGPKPVALLVLDGWGIGPNNPGNAIAKAHTPNMDRYWLTFPHTQLSASGEAVGLPRGEDGNTETGHLNIGAGHIVYQDLPRINMAIADGTFNTTQAFLNAVEHVKRNNSTLHIMGLIGAGGVHSNIEHLYALLNFCKTQGLEKVFIHGFTDGRDSPPTSGINYVQQIMDRCKQLGVGKLASLMGRYYAMDRDHRWERIEKAYKALTQGSGDSCILDPIQILQKQYDNGTTDEFIEPICICDEDGTHRIISDNDAAIFFNYRVDRPRELTRAFVQTDFEQGISNQAFDPYTEKYKKTNIQEQVHVTTFKREKVIQNLYFVTMTRYEETLQTDVAFPPQNIKNPLCKVISQRGLRQLRITETEKERFVTYYMNGQEETMYPGEDRVIIPSKGVKSYDQAPEMSAYEIASEMITRIKQGQHNVIISNICNGDMVGHTGNFDASVRACEIVDEVVGKIVSEIYARGGVVLITADHGNVEEMISSTTGEVDTEHSIYPVPLLIIGKQFANKPIMLPTGILADVAPTMLSILGIKKPDSMTGRALV